MAAVSVTQLAGHAVQVVAVVAPVDEEKVPIPHSEHAADPLATL